MSVMIVERIPMTREGHESLRREIEHLKGTERPRIIRELEAARVHGDLSENAEYHAAKERLGHVQGRVLDLENKLSRAEVIDPRQARDKNRVTFGAHVTLTNIDGEGEKTYQLVGELESDATNGRISITSPLGRALIGKKLSDVVTVKAPKGDTEYELIRIEYK